MAPDLRGHGESGRSPLYRLDDFVADATCVVDALADRPLAIVGGSIGGALGLLLAGERGLPVAALVLVDVPTAPRPAAQQERARIAAARSLGVPALASLDPEIMTGPFVDEVVADLEQWRRAARHVRVPVLLVRGRRSGGIGARELSAFIEDLPHGETCDIDAGHLVARDQPRELARALTAFLARVLAR